MYKSFHRTHNLVDDSANTEELMIFKENIRIELLYATKIQKSINHIN